MTDRYEILINDNVWSFYPKSRDGLLLAIDELDLAMSEPSPPADPSDTFRLVYSVYDADKGAIVDPAHPAKLLQRYDVYDVEWGDIEPNGYLSSRTRQRSKIGRNKAPGEKMQSKGTRKCLSGVL